MCIKKILAWFKPAPTPVPEPEPIPEPIPTPMVKRILLSFAINDYPGTGNDLNGCVNDQENISAKLLSLWPDFDVRKFKNKEATVACYKEQVAKAIGEMRPGGTVLVLPDCCFSGTNTRFMNNPEHPTKNRFMPVSDLPQRDHTRVRVFRSKMSMKWIVISGCGEHQTSADAFIDGKYNGAFTYFLVKALIKGMTYRQWYDALRDYLPSDHYEQAPEHDGPGEIFARMVGEGDTLIIHNSSHGTYTYDASGDESDGNDEAICFYDDILIDDEINELLQKIPV